MGQRISRWPERAWRMSMYEDLMDMSIGEIQMLLVEWSDDELADSLDWIEGQHTLTSHMQNVRNMLQEEIWHRDEGLWRGPEYDVYPLGIADSYDNDDVPF
jgi:hypothetical protein